MKRYSWVNIQKGDPIPINAVEGGVRRKHGTCYVGMFQEVVGNIILDENKMMSCFMKKKYLKVGLSLLLRNPTTTKNNILKS